MHLTPAVDVWCYCVCWYPCDRSKGNSSTSYGAKDGTHCVFLHTFGRLSPSSMRTKRVLYCVVKTYSLDGCKWKRNVSCVLCWCIIIFTTNVGKASRNTTGFSSAFQFCPIYAFCTVFAFTCRAAARCRAPKLHQMIARNPLQPTAMIISPSDYVLTASLLLNGTVPYRCWPMNHDHRQAPATTPHIITAIGNLLDQQSTTRQNPIHSQDHIAGSNRHHRPLCNWVRWQHTPKVELALTSRCW